MLVESKLTFVFLTQYGHVIYPGNNVIPSDQEDSFLKSVDIPEMIQKGKLLVSKNKSVNEGDPSKGRPLSVPNKEVSPEAVIDDTLKGLMEMNEKDAMAAVEGMLDIRVLRVVARRDKRKKVQIAAEQAVDKLMKKDEEK